MDEKTDKYVVKEFASLNGLGRPAMFFGVPLVAGLVVVAIAITTSFLAQIKFGMLGFLIFFLFIPILIVIRQLTSTDDHALRILFFEVKFFLKKIFSGNKIYRGKFFIITDNNLKHDTRYFRKFTETYETKRKRSKEKVSD